MTPASIVHPQSESELCASGTKRRSRKLKVILDEFPPSLCFPLCKKCSNIEYEAAGLRSTMFVLVGLIDEEFYADVSSELREF